MVQREHRKTKTSSLKEILENTDLHKAVLKITMTTQEYCIKYDFVAPKSKSDYSRDNSYCVRLEIVSLAVNIGKLQSLVSEDNFFY